MALERGTEAAAGGDGICAGRDRRGGILRRCQTPVLCPGGYRREARRKARGKTTAVISPLAQEAVRSVDALFDIEPHSMAARAIGEQGVHRS